MTHKIARYTGIAAVALVLATSSRAETVAPVAPIATEVAHFTIEKDDISIRGLLYRWSYNEKLAFEWNANYNLMLTQDTKGREAMNTKLSKITAFEEAVDYALHQVKPDKPQHALLDVCYGPGVMMVFSSDQPSCGHVDPVKTKLPANTEDE